MAGDTKPMPMAPRQGPTQIGNAAIQWARSRRGRVLVVTVVLMLLVLELAGARHSETLSSSYHALSSNYKLPSWHPHAPTPTASPLRPSNTTLELENGAIDHVPAHLTKATPNFHLLMPALDEDDEFCKTTLSGMLLDYPPPTIINLYEQFENMAEAEKARLEGVLRYLSNRKMVNDDDLVLIVDGRDTWFQLPSEVIIRQYQDVLEDANKRLASKYGGNFTQTIVFGAVKTCEGEDLACKYYPPSMLPDDIYGKETNKETQRTPARYLDSDMLMGPAKDLTVLYEAAVKVFEEKKSQEATTHSVMSTIFGQQQAMRQTQRRKIIKVVPSRWLDYFDGSAVEAGLEAHERHLNATLQEIHQFEFKIGLDYTHTLFQPLLYCSADELVPLVHDNSTDLSWFHHMGTPTPPLAMPSALRQAKLPFWTPDLRAHNPSPNEKSAYIEKLEYDNQLDHLKSHGTMWEQIKLIQNTYTGAIPAVFHVNNRSPSQIFRAKRKGKKRPSANITWKSLWYSTYERALLRKYFRNSQSPIGYHTAATGGDRLWDSRGGRGGIWTEKEALWLPWGEADGVCGSVKQIRNAFGDEKGVWLHELDDGKGEEQRKKDEQELRDKALEKERVKVEKEKEKLGEEQEQREKEKQDKVDKEDELRKKVDEQKKKEEEQRIKKEEEEAERAKQEKEQKAYEEGQDRLDYEEKGDNERVENHEGAGQKHADQH